MATLKDLHDILIEAGIPGVSPDTITRIITEMKRSLPGEKLYIPSHGLSKKPDIIEAARTLPSAMVAERYGVTRRYVNKIISRKRAT